MAYFILVALLLSGVTAYPDPWQQRPRERPQNRPYGGPAMEPGGGFWMQDHPRPPFGFQPMGGGRFWPEPMGPRPGPMGPRPGPMEPRPGPMGDGGYFPRPVIPTMSDWEIDEAEQPWLPDGPTVAPEGEDQSNAGWPNGDNQFDGPPEFPDRGDKRGPGSRRPWQGQWGAASRGPQRGMRPNRRNPNRRPGGADGRVPFAGRPVTPNVMANRQFTPILKVDNVTLPNISGLPLKEGENIFLLPTVQQNAPQEMRYGYPSYGPQPYIKLIYNPTATQKISFEYGITQLLPSFMKAEPAEDEEEENKRK